MEDKQKRIAASLNPPFYLFSNIITGPVLGGRSSKSEPDCAALKPEVQKRLRSKGDKSGLGAL
jgi:hypothetical protein